MKLTIRRPETAGLLLAGILALSGLLVASALPAQTDVRLPGLRGGELTSRDLASGATVVVVWASWSPRCRDLVERANAIASRWGGQARVVTVDFQESPEEVERFLAGKSLQPPVYLDRDGEFAKAHAIATLPGLIVFKDGQARYQGKLPPDADGTIADALR